MTYKKISILALAFILSLLAGFTLMQNERTKDNENKLGDTHNYTPSISYSDESKAQSSIESDTIERLKTHSESGTDWGMSPFGSGKPLTEETLEIEAPQKTAFQMPNTEWKTRTISGVTYEFGKGNPKEVALDQAGLEMTSKEKCTDPEKDRNLYSIGFCNSENGLLKYVTPEVEKHILEVLSDPNWKKLATECENDLRILDTPETYVNVKNDPSVVYYDKLFSLGFLDLDSFITIEPTTGWKRLDTQKTIGVVHYLMCAMNGGCKGEEPNSHKNCVNRYGSNIVRHLEIATNIYLAPLNTDGSFSLDPAKFPIPNWWY